MKPFLTLLLDSFRSLKSGTIFWVTLSLSLLVALVFLSIGFDDQGISILFGAKTWESDILSKGSPFAHVGYLLVFSNFVAGGWLTFVAIILALISCASIFPDAMNEGTAGMLMTKKPSRLQVFLAKLTGSLFFVLVQVGLFVVIVFIAFRWRLGVWSFSLFWYVPAVLLVFLNLYSFMVFIGIKTRSVMTAILLTMALWGVSAGLNWVTGLVELQYESSRYEYVQVEPEEGEEVEEDKEPSSNGYPEMEMVEKEPNESIKDWADTLKAIHTVFPKNAPIMKEAEKKLLSSEIEGLAEAQSMDSMLGSDEDRREIQREIEKATKEDSWFYSIGSSCLFALVMLTLAGWTFCRRDY